MEREGVILPGAARLIRILALTGMRLGEVFGLRWAWLDIPAACIRLPDAKAGARAVPLGAVALAYLNGLERTARSCAMESSRTSRLATKPFVVRGQSW